MDPFLNDAFETYARDCLNNLLTIGNVINTWKDMLLTGMSKSIPKDVHKVFTGDIGVCVAIG